jgi:putative FmdB family regulatory protein
MTYAYKCRQCQTYTEVEQRMTDEPLKTCGHCGGSIHRVMFPPGIVFKGSGFYKTDYAHGRTPLYDAPTTTVEACEVPKPKE